MSQHDPKSRLYTPGPVQICDAVRLAASRKTLGSREPEFCNYIKSARAKLLEIAGVSDEYTVVPMQGSGTYGVECAIQTVVPSDARLLVVSNGSFGERMAKIAKLYCPSMKHVSMNYFRPVDLEELDREIQSFKPTHLGMVHSETSSGVINDVITIGKKYSLNQDLIFLVDGMSSFGGILFNMEECGIDFLMTSPNKCLESIAGVGIVFARKKSLLEATYSRTLVLDVLDQYNFFEKYNMFRYTPPLECIVALEQACVELLKETVKGRQERYIQNTKYVRSEMKRIGFKGYLTDEINGHIVSVFDFPKSENFKFLDFYQKLVDCGCRIYYFPGKRLDRDVIRIGTIGWNNVETFKVLITNIERISKELKFFDQ